MLESLYISKNALVHEMFIDMKREAEAEKEEEKKSQVTGKNSMKKKKPQ